MMKKEIKAAVYGSSGFAGEELLKLLEKRKEVKIVYLPGRKEIREDEKIPSGIDVAFLATPPNISMAVVPKLLQLGIKVIDLSGAFRLKSRRHFEKWYGVKHNSFGLVYKAVYGLPEKQRGVIKSADLVACPGCYPTVAILGILPILSIAPVCPKTSIKIEAVSGYSGAGKDVVIPKEVTRYTTGREHRHIPEIEQELGLGEQLFFSAWKAPWPRGIEMEIIFFCRYLYADIEKLYQKFYKTDSFVKVVNENIDLEKVIGTNYCYILPRLENGVVRINVLVDNLLKGAAGQAIQNFNLMFGFKEEEGLL